MLGRVIPFSIAKGPLSSCIFQKCLSPFVSLSPSGQCSNSTGSPSIPSLSVEEKMEVDGRSVYVGNVDYGATAEELEQARMISFWIMQLISSKVYFQLFMNTR